jgi:hypothetical protein
MDRRDRLTLWRCLVSWRWHAKQKHWKKLAHAKDEQIVFLLSKLEEAQSRGIGYCRRQRLRRILGVWISYAQYRKERREDQERASAFADARRRSRVFSAWKRVAEGAVVARQRERDAVDHHEAALVAGCLASWKRRAADAAERSREWKKKTLILTLCAWRYAAGLRRGEEEAVRRAKARAGRLLSSACVGWRRESLRSRRLQEMEDGIASRASASLLFRTFAVWHAHMHDSVRRRLLEQGIFSIETIRGLVDDNKRLTSLINTSLSVTEQVAHLREASEAQQRLLTAVLDRLSLDRRMGRLQPNERRGISHPRVPRDCPDVFLRLAYGKNNETRREREAGGTDKGTVASGEGGVRSPHATKAILAVSNNKNASSEKHLGSLVTSVVSVHEADFFAVLRRVDQAFDELGWVRAV